MLLLQCPRCKNRMKYQGKGVYLAEKSKKCVYCNRTFKVLGNIIKENKIQGN